jgi:hypothetical protein
LDFLRANPQFQLLRRAVAANPDILAPMLQVSLRFDAIFLGCLLQIVLCRVRQLCSVQSRVRSVKFVCPGRSFVVCDIKFKGYNQRSSSC